MMLARQNTLLVVLSLLTFSFAVEALALDHRNAATRKYPEVQSILRTLAKEHPANAQIFELGVNDHGDKIEGLKIGNGPLSNLVVGTHHGNEYGAAEVALAVAESLTLSPIQGQTVYVIPVLNISGYNARRRNEVVKGKSWDSNRNYPGPCGTEGPFTLKSTRALADFVEREKIVTSATLHTFFPAVVYPWGLASRDLSTPHDDLFKQLVEAAAIESKYQTGNSTKVIYPANGTYEDYVYWQHGVWSILFELGLSHKPKPEAVQKTVDVNVPGIRRLLEQAPRVRADKHGFDGRCDDSLISLDRHDE